MIWLKKIILILIFSQKSMSTRLYSNIIEILQKRVISQPHKIVYTFLKDGENDLETLTYQELDQRAKAIANHLYEIAKPLRNINEPLPRALLVYPYNNGLDFIVAFFGCLYAQIIAVPCHPPTNRLTTKEVQERLISAQAQIILTHSNLASKLQENLAEFKNDNLTWLITDKIKTKDVIEYPQLSIQKDDLAFFQYTSGSTGEPKGVMITHDAIMQNQEMLKQAFGHSSESVGVGWLPLFHDMGLIGNVIQAVYLGASCVMFSPISFVQKPIRWIEAISRYQATTSGAPNFAYELLCDQVKDEQLVNLDLSSWEVAFSGAEPVLKETIERFSQKFAVCGFNPDAFFPCYGMAEATLFITGANKNKPPVIKYVDKASLEENKVLLTNEAVKGSRSIISCGRPYLNSKILIVNPKSLTKCKTNEVGEIWVSSASLGQGYWQQPELTAKTFQAYVKDSNEGAFLRTGDLGFIDQQELFISGRLNDVMVFWGFNHYPQNLEQTVAECHPALQSSGGAAFSVEVGGKERLVIVQEVKRTYRNSIVVEDVVETIRLALFREHFIDVLAIALIKPFSLPKTSSGKVQRKTCKTKFLENNLEIIAQWHSPETESSNMTSLLQRYLNPLTYLKISTSIARGKFRRWLYLFLQKTTIKIDN